MTDEVTPQTPIQPAEQSVQAIPDAMPQDRAAFNCVMCNGEGLVSEDKLCPECGGTGKTKGDYAAMRPGTIVVTSNGTFTVDDYGQLVLKE